MKARGSQPALEEPGIGMPAAAVRQKGNRLPQEVSEMIIVSVNDLADENGWAFLRGCRQPPFKEAALV